MSELKPCPFCGETEPVRLIVSPGKDGWRDRYFVLCNYEDGGCGAESGWYHSEIEAIEAWNRRVDMGKWIPVTERLPRRHKNVLCCGARGGMFVGWFTNISAISDNKTIAYVHGGNGRYVTHWMPLPEPPKEET